MRIGDCCVAIGVAFGSFAGLSHAADQPEMVSSWRSAECSHLPAFKPHPATENDAVIALSIDGREERVRALKRVFLRTADEFVSTGEIIEFNSPWLCFRTSDLGVVAIDVGDVTLVSEKAIEGQTRPSPPGPVKEASVPVAEETTDPFTWDGPTLILSADDEDSLELYKAFAANDVARAAVELDDGLADELRGIGDKGFKREQFVARIKSDPKIKKRYTAIRAKLAGSSVSWTLGDPKVTYADKKFWLVLGSQQLHRGGQAQKSTRYAAGCLKFYGGGITLVKWPRVRCTVSYGISMRCEAELAGLPSALKGRIEDDLGTALSARVRWKGLPTVENTQAVVDGFAYAEEWFHPTSPSIEFIDADGKSVWSAK